MSKKETKSEVMQAQEVSDFLQEHPTFLLENPEILREIELKARVPEGVISLIEYQVAAFKEQNKSLSYSLVNIRDVAQANEKVWLGIYEFLCALMQVKKKANSKGYWDEVRLLVEQQFNLDDVACFELGERNRKAVKDYLNDKISSDDREKKALIIKKQYVDELSQLVFNQANGSMVLFNIDPKANRVMILAATDPQRYSEGLGTIQLERLVGAIRSHAGINA